MVITHFRHAIGVAILTTLGLTANIVNAAEVNVSVGASNHELSFETGDAEIDSIDISDTGTHLGFGLKNQYGEHGQHFFGVGIDIDKIDGDQLIGYRALDYQFAFNQHIRAGAFFGAASLDTGLPQNGYYTGLNLSYQGIFDHLGITFELRHGNGLERDKKLADDPARENDKEYMFLDFTATAVQVSWTF